MSGLEGNFRIFVEEKENVMENLYAMFQII